MSPSHSTKNSKRYRYYLSQAYIQRRKEDAGSLTQIPAPELEKHLIGIIQNTLREKLQYDSYDLSMYKTMKKRLEEFCTKEWASFEERFIVRKVIEKIIVSSDKYKLTVKMNVLKKIAEYIWYNKKLEGFQEMTKNDIQEFEENIQLRRVNKGTSLSIGEHQVNRNEAMIKLVKQSFELHEQLLSGIGFEELQNTLQITKRRLDRILYMRFLSPDILKKILTGTQLEHWNTHLMYNCYKIDFKKQREYFGI